MSDDSELGSEKWILNLVLFLLTLLTATLAGVQWAGKDPLEPDNFKFGIEYSLAILFVLACHEFGHFFAARRHRVSTTLPFFIPFPPLPFLLNFGTLGAVIRTRSIVPSRKAMFDIGVAGPLAGFVACLFVIIYGLVTLPGPEYILSIHPQYDFSLNAVPNNQGLPLQFGQTIMFSSLLHLLTDPTQQFVPPMTEIYHYPYLCVGWFGLFVTAMNLIPIGQFDGGHIIYTMFGGKQKLIARISFFSLVLLGLPSILDSLLHSLLSFFQETSGGQLIPLANLSWSGWFLWAMISYFVVKLDHPPIQDETPLDPTRMKIGWLSMIIFLLCFSFIPFTLAL